MASTKRPEAEAKPWPHFVTTFLDILSAVHADGHLSIVLCNSQYPPLSSFALNNPVGERNWTLPELAKHQELGPRANFWVPVRCSRRHLGCLGHGSGGIIRHAQSQLRQLSHDPGHMASSSGQDSPLYIRLSFHRETIKHVSRRIHSIFCVLTQRNSSYFHCLVLLLRRVNRRHRQLNT